MTSCVSRISVFTHRNDLGGAVWNPAIRLTRKYPVFVVVEDDAGVQALAKCWCFDPAPDAHVALLRTEVVPKFLGVALADAQSGRVVRLFRPVRLPE